MMLNHYLNCMQKEYLVYYLNNINFENILQFFQNTATATMFINLSRML